MNFRFDEDEFRSRAAAALHGAAGCAAPQRRRPESGGPHHSRGRGTPRPAAVLVPLVPRAGRTAPAAHPAPPITCAGMRARWPFRAAASMRATRARSPRRCARPRRKRASPGLRGALGLPRHLSHRNHLPGGSGGGTAAARLHRDAACGRGGGCLRGAAGLPDEPGASRDAIRATGRAASATTMPCPGEGRYIWGATAGMIRNLYALLYECAMTASPSLADARWLTRSSAAARLRRHRARRAARRAWRVVPCAMRFWVSR